jgi:hypothetical protein
MELSTQACGTSIQMRGTARESKYGLTEADMKATGVGTRQMAREDLFMPMEMCTKDNG